MQNHIADVFRQQDTIAELESQLHESVFESGAGVGEFVGINFERYLILILNKESNKTPHAFQ